MGTPIQLVFYEDNVILRWRSFDRFFTVFSSVRLPLGTTYLSELHSFPPDLTLDDFVIHYFGNDLVNFYISQPIPPPDDTR